MRFQFAQKRRTSGRQGMQFVESSCGSLQASRLPSFDANRTRLPASMLKVEPLIAQDRAKLPQRLRRSPGAKAPPC